MVDAGGYDAEWDMAEVSGRVMSRSVVLDGGASAGRAVAIADFPAQRWCVRGFATDDLGLDRDRYDTDIRRVRVDCAVAAWCALRW